MSSSTSPHQSNISFPTPQPNTLHETAAPSLTASPLIDLIEQVARKFVASLTQAAIKSFNGRLERGLDLARQGAVTPLLDPAHPRCFLVRSLDSNQIYRVNLGAKTCDCPDSQKGNTCKHRIAAYYIEQANKQKPADPQSPDRPSSSSVLPTPVPTSAQSVEPTKAVIEPITSPIPPEPETTPKPKPQPQASKAAAPLSRTDQILADLGFTPEPPKPAAPALQLGTLYCRYLRGKGPCRR